ncbi:MAG TPA: TadE/TadG family type IV pilus assembly protein [Chloroflexota bacterium]|jgi:Flp pilus assembly protein TadG|nr:TadE/TadG family type IV pilus assembly protein [Chloroflexota bacterium]
MKKLFKSQRGSTITELAFILPVLLLFLMIIMEGSHVLNVWMVLSNETREAARYAVAGVRVGDTNLVSEVTSYAQAQIGGMVDPTPLNITVSVQMSGTQPTSVSVTSNYTVDTVTPLLQALVPSFPVSTTSVMRAE